MDIEALTSQLQTYTKSQPEIVAVYLYGSQAKDTARPDSDVDLAVLLRAGHPNPFKAELALQVELVELTGIDKLEVAVLNRVSLKLRAEVFISGRLLFCTDNDERIPFEVKTMSEYWDMKPLYDLHTRLYRERMKELMTDDQRRAYASASGAASSASEQAKSAKNT